MALRKCTMICLMKKDGYSKVYELWPSSKGMGLNRNLSISFVAEIKGELISAIMAGNNGWRGYIYPAVHFSIFRKLI